MATVWPRPATTATRSPALLRAAITVFILSMVWRPALCATADLAARRIPDEQRLYETIMDDYQLSVMPRANTSVPLSVAFSLRLNQIVSLDERQQVLTTNVFIDQTWIDPSLAWNPANFSDVRAMRIPADHVWLPDTFVYNNADGGTSGFMQGTYVQIQSDGRVLWPVPLRLRSSCSVHITYFPFDSQVCTLRFGSWIYGMSQVDYTPIKDGLTVDLSTYINNSEWELVGIAMNKQHSLTPTGGPGVLRRLGPHSLLTYVLHLKRNTFFYLFNIIVPCVMLSTLNILTFWLPPVSGEKVTLGLSVFLAFSMFMLLIAEEVPATSEAVPLIGVYLCVVMTMTSLSVIMAVVVTNLYHKGRKMKSAPRWLVNVCLHWLATPFCVSNDVILIASTVDLVEHCQYDLSRRKKSQAVLANVDEDNSTQSQHQPVHHTSLNGNLSVLPTYLQNGGDLSRDLHGVTSPGAVACGVSHTNPRATPLWTGQRQRTRTAKEVHPRARNSVANSYQFSAVPTATSDLDEPLHAREQEAVWIRRGVSLSSQRPYLDHDDRKAVADKDETLEKVESSPSSPDTARPRFSLGCETTDPQHQNDAGKESAVSSTDRQCRDDPHPDSFDRLDPRADPTGKLDPHPDSADLQAARMLVAEWQQIATVVDRLMFVLYLLSTVTAYIVILAVVPANQPPVVTTTRDNAGMSLDRWTT